MCVLQASTFQAAIYLVHKLSVRSYGALLYCTREYMLNKVCRRVCVNGRTFEYVYRSSMICTAGWMAVRIVGTLATSSIHFESGVRAPSLSHSVE